MKCESSVTQFACIKVILSFELARSDLRHSFAGKGCNFWFEVISFKQRPISRVLNFAPNANDSGDCQIATTLRLGERFTRRTNVRRIDGIKYDITVWATLSSYLNVYFRGVQKCRSVEWHSIISAEILLKSTSCSIRTRLTDLGANISPRLTSSQIDFRH